MPLNQPLEWNQDVVWGTQELDELYTRYLCVFKHGLSKKLYFLFNFKRNAYDNWKFALVPTIR